MGGKTTLAPLISDGARTEIAQSSLSRLVSERHRLPALLAFLAFLPLSVVPYLGKPAGNVSSAGTARGYNTALAYEFVLLVSMAIMGAFALREWRNPTPRAAQEPAVAPGHRPIARPIARPWLEPLLFFALFAVLYFPGFLARYGPYNEDNYFLTVLHRMNSGLRPYRDFEFAYGPLMVYTAHGWMLAFGYSMRSYYALVCVLEALQFSALILVLRRWIPNFRTRMLVFGFLTVFLFNTLLGLNWNGIRRLLPLAAILCAASVPSSMARLLAAASLCGLSMAYSPDLGIPCLIAVMSVHVLGYFKTRDLNCLGRAGVFVAASCAVWLAVIGLLLGRTLSAYVQAAWYVIQRFSAGEAGFPFYWTLNSLAAFALLALCCMAVGGGLGKRSAAPLAAGDRLFFASVCFALLALRSGLNRADMWHVNAPFLPLFFAFVVPWPRSLFRLSSQAHGAALVILAVMCVSYIPAVLPSGSYYFAGWRSGLGDWIHGRRVYAAGVGQTKISSRAPLIELERSRPDPAMLALAHYLAAEERGAQPVIFYSEAWAADKRAGVYKAGFATDDVLLDDAAGEQIRGVLENSRGAFAVLTRDEYSRVYGTGDAAGPAPLPFYSRTFIKDLAGWTSTVHFRAMEFERLARQARWYRTAGWYLRSHYVLAGDFGEYMLLSQVNRQ